jgi:hypothetical protein
MVIVFFSGIWKCPLARGDHTGGLGPIGAEVPARPDRTGRLNPAAELSKTIQS